MLHHLQSVYKIYIFSFMVCWSKKYFIHSIHSFTFYVYFFLSESLLSSCFCNDVLYIHNYVFPEGKSVICPDGEHQCEDNQTCCKSAEGYSCCPLPNVCYGKCCVYFSIYRPACCITCLLWVCLGCACGDWDR